MRALVLFNCCALQNCSKEVDGNKLVEHLDSVVSSVEASKERHVDYC